MFKKFTWGHGIVLAMLCFISFILFMIFIFPNGQQNSELITDNYYEEELAYQDVIDAKNRADKLPEKPKYEQLPSGIKITFPTDTNSKNTKVRFDLFRTDDKRLDVKKDVELAADNSFTIPAKVLAKGNYTLKVHWKKNNLDYQTDYDVVWTQP